jgi:hypothetical protein
LRWDDADLAADTFRVRGQLQRDPDTGGLVLVETKDRGTIRLPVELIRAAEPVRLDWGSHGLAVRLTSRLQALCRLAVRVRPRA